MASEIKVEKLDKSKVGRFWDWICQKLNGYWLLAICAVVCFVLAIGVVVIFLRTYEWGGGRYACQP